MELYKIVVIAAGFLSGVTFLTVSIIGFMRDNYIKTKGIQTQAEIVEIKRNGGNRKPVIEYQTPGGMMRAKSFYSGSGIFFNCNVGDKVNIFYDEKKPKSFRFENNKTGVFLWGLFFFIGIMEIITSCFIPFLLK